MITLTAKITLADGTTYDVDKRNLLSLDSKIVDRSDIAMPSWGIISNSGRISFIDYNGDIRRYAQSQLLVSGCNVEIYLTDTLAKTTYPLNNCVTSTWDYDSNRREVSVSLTDGLQEWQDTVVDVLPFNANTSQNVNGEYIYNHWRGKTPSKFKMKFFAELDEDTQTALSQFSVSLFISEATNLWSAWATFCEAVQARIYINNQGEAIFTCRD